MATTKDCTEIPVIEQTNNVRAVLIEGALTGLAAIAVLWLAQAGFLAIICLNIFNCGGC